MADPKPSTSDILAKIRAAKSAGAAPPPPADAPAPAAESPVEQPIAAAEVPAAESPAPAPAAPAPAGDKPKSTSDIMAAIRAKKAAEAGAAPAAAAPAAPKPAGEKPAGTSSILASIRKGGAGAPAAATPAAAAPKPAAAKSAAPVAGDRPSVQEMLKAVKQAEAGVTPAAATAVKPKLPGKGAPGKKDAAIPRRSVAAAAVEFLATPYYLAWSLMAAIGGVWSLAIARFMMPNTVLELPSKFKVGPPSDYPFGKVSEKFKAARGVWIVNTEFDGQPTLYALSSVCTHLGCTPGWLEAEQKFKCPCHGSGFYITGVNFEGPAPRPLERVGLSLSPDGQLVVDKSIKFQEELGQWADPKSFVRG
jgi:cytochrome b6-f complex iron-sulfur subunit